MTNLDSILKSRDITLSIEVHVAVCRCKSWTIKKAECWRVDAFELWCWRRLLQVPWTARRATQSILKEISPGCSLDGLMLKLKLQYFGHLMQRADSLENILMLGKIEGRRRGSKRMRQVYGMIDSMDMSLSKFWELVISRECCSPWVAKSRTWLNNWIELKKIRCLLLDIVILFFLDSLGYYPKIISSKVCL